MGADHRPWLGKNHQRWYAVYGAVIGAAVSHRANMLHLSAGSSRFTAGEMENLVAAAKRIADESEEACRVLCGGGVFVEP